MNAKKFYYISCGSNVAIYTLHVRGVKENGTAFDTFLTNLSSDPEAAEQEALAHVKAINGNSAEPIAIYEGFDVDDINPRFRVAI
jgi:hypothetical protein